MPPSTQAENVHKNDAERKSPASKQQQVAEQTLIWAASPQSVLQAALRNPHSLTPGRVAQLQRAFGNQALGAAARFAQGQAPPHKPAAKQSPTTSTHSDVAQRQEQQAETEEEELQQEADPIQAKLTLGATDDPYEQEADRVARQVVQRLSDSSSIVANSPIEEQSPLQRQASQPENRVDATVERSIQAKRGNGQRLSDDVRTPMEQAFGANFGDVHIHTDGEADRLNRKVQARAFTTGRDIFFRRGEYQPGSGAGKELIAHELTHVVQQGGVTTVPKIQRRELNVGLGWRLFNKRGPGDWYFQDRLQWQQASIGGNPGSLSQSNTFLLAAIYNTQNLRDQEYRNVEQRHDYYDLISFVIEHDPNTPVSTRGVRFFHATTLVTGSPGIGTVDSPAGAAMLKQDTRVILREVNEKLFQANMRIIRDLLFNWREPRNPQKPQAKIESFEFDVQMVEMEQGLVERYIQQNQSRFTDDVVQDINSTLDPSDFGQSLNPSQRSFQWALKALGVANLDFTNREHRMAIGFATVHLFHRKNLEEFLTFMQQRIHSPAPQRNIQPKISYPTLKFGQRNEHVGILQEKLNTANMTPLQLLSVTRYFGRTTERHVKFFQQRQGLIIDGVVGNKTWEALEQVTRTKNNRATTSNDHSVQRHERDEALQTERAFITVQRHLTRRGSATTSFQRLVAPQSSVPIKVERSLGANVWGATEEVQTIAAPLSSYPLLQRNTSNSPTGDDNRFSLTAGGESIHQATKEQAIKFLNNRLLLRLRLKSDAGIDRHKAQKEIREEQYIVGAVSDFLAAPLKGGIDLPPLAIWNQTHQLLTQTAQAIHSGRFSEALNLAQQTEKAYHEAYQTVRQYIEGTISGAERAVTGLEITRDVSVVVVGAATTVATGGTAAALISTGLAATQQVAQQGMEVHYDLRKQIDWAGIGFDALFGLVTSYIGGRLGNAAAAKILGSNPAAAALGHRVIARLVDNLVSGRASDVIHTEFRLLFDMVRGQAPIMTPIDLGKKLIERLLDPKAAFMDLVHGEIAHATQQRAQAMKQRSNATSADSSGQDQSQTKSTAEHETTPETDTRRAPQPPAAAKPSGKTDAPAGASEHQQRAVFEAMLLAVQGAKATGQKTGHSSQQTHHSLEPPNTDTVESSASHNQPDAGNTTSRGKTAEAESTAAQPFAPTVGETAQATGQHLSALKQALHRSAGGDHNSVAYDAIREVGDFNQLRKLVEAGELGSDKATAQKQLQQTRKAMVDVVLASIQQDVAQRYPGVEIKMEDHGTPGFSSDRDITLRANPKEGSHVPVTELVAASVEAVRDAYSKLNERGLPPDKALDTNFYVELHEGKLAPANPTEAHATRHAQDVVSMAEMRMGMTAEQWHSYTTEQLRSLSNGQPVEGAQGSAESEARSRLREQFTQAEQLAHRMGLGQDPAQKRSLLAQQQESLLAALRRQPPPSTVELRQLMAEIKLLEPDAYGTRAAVEGVVNYQQGLARAKTQARVREVQQSRSVFSRQGNEPISGHLASLTQEGSASLAKMFGHAHGASGNSAKTVRDLAKYLSRIHHAFSELGLRMDNPMVDRSGNVVASKLETDSTAATVRELRSWAQEQNLSHLTDQQLIDTWVTQSQAVGQQMVVRMRSQQQMAQAFEAPPIAHNTPDEAKLSNTGQL